MGESFDRIRLTVTQFFGRLNNTQRLIFSGVAVVALALTILALVMTGAPPYEPLFSDLSPKDAGEIIDQLREQNVDYRLENGGRTIVVPASRVYELRIEFARAGLPEVGSIGYELFDKQELGVTEFQQKVAYKRAMEGELSRTIRSIDGVENANVMIVIPKERLFEKDQQVPTASVLLKLKRRSKPNEMTIEAISHLVANSVEGMEADNVTITDTQGRILSQNRGPNDMLSMSSDQLAFTRNIEQDLERKARNVLEKRVGPGNATVQVNATLDWAKVEKTIQDVDPDRTVTISEETSEQTEPGDPNSGAAGSSSSNTITNFETSRTIQKIVEGVGNMTRLSVAVMVNHKPQSVTDEEGVESTEYAPRDAQEMQQLEQLVKTSVGFNSERNDQFSIVNMQFDPTIEETIEELPWWGNFYDIFEKVFIVAVLLASIFLVRSILKGAKERGEEIQLQMRQILREDDGDATGLPSGSAAGMLPEGTAGNENESVIKSPEFFKATLKQNMDTEKVQKFVKTNPDAATKLLKVWLMENEEVG